MLECKPVRGASHMADGTRTQHQLCMVMHSMLLTALMIMEAAATRSRQCQ